MRDIAMGFSRPGAIGTVRFGQEDPVESVRQKLDAYFAKKGITGYGYEQEAILAGPKITQVLIIKANNPAHKTQIEDVLKQYGRGMDIENKSTYTAYKLQNVLINVELQ
jgi:hypothetical protein